MPGTGVPSEIGDTGKWNNRERAQDKREGVRRVREEEPLIFFLSPFVSLTGMPWSSVLAMGSLHITHTLSYNFFSLSTLFHEREFNESDAITCIPKKQQKQVSTLI